MKRLVEENPDTHLLPVKLYLRHDQTFDMTTAYFSDDVVIYAPEWMQRALALISPQLDGLRGAIYQKGGVLVEGHRPIVIEKAMTLQQLLMFSRNEACNTSGLIHFDYYPASLDQKIILTIKDLVRHCVIVGKDKAHSYGGFGGAVKESLPLSQDVYICDLAGLQFQCEYNSGRLVLIGKDLPKGKLDDFIYLNTVGEVKKSWEECIEDQTGRFEQVNISETTIVYFDTFAYKKFVAQDVVLTGLALNEAGERDNKDILFKFLHYGAGYFAGKYKAFIVENILEGVLNGLKILFENYHPKRIKAIELPYFEQPIAIQKKFIKNCKTNFGIEIVISEADALKKTRQELIVATTNCADPHVATGNEMNHSSVDAAIAENLESKGHKFSALLNRSMKAKFFLLDLQVHPKEEKPKKGKSKPSELEQSLSTYRFTYLSSSEFFSKSCGILANCLSQVLPGCKFSPSEERNMLGISLVRHLYDGIGLRRTDVEIIDIVKKTILEGMTLQVDVITLTQDPDINCWIILSPKILQQIVSTSITDAHQDDSQLEPTKR